MAETAKSRSQQSIDRKAGPRSGLPASLSLRILLGLLAGVGCGIFFGEHCAPLSVVGEIFVGLLQMTVLPYIAVTVVASLARLTWNETRKLAVVTTLTLISLWVIAMLAVAVLPEAFPEWSASSFFSTALLETPTQRSWVDFFVPANVLDAFANNRVPAVVLFCICAGIALARTKRRDVVLAPLELMADILLRISMFIANLAPIGIFAIAAATAGTVSIDEFLRLQSYLFAYIAGTLFLGGVALPLLVTSITPLSYRQVVRVVREPVLTAFATGKLVIVLPMLVQNTEKLLIELTEDVPDEDIPAMEVMYATAYPFPHVGKILTMLFIPFAAWFLGTPMNRSDYPIMLVGGVFSYFGGPLLAIPYLLDQARLPHDMFQLFLLSGVLGERFGDALGAIHLATLTLISFSWFRGWLQLTVAGVARYVGVVVVAGLITMVGVSATLSYTTTDLDSRDEVLARMQLLDEQVPHRIARRAGPNPVPLKVGESLLERVRRRGTLRVGFNEDKIPFAFFSQYNRLVGYDVNMAHALARDLGVTLEFVRFDRTTLVQQLQDDHFDVVMSGLAGTLERSEQLHHTDSYLDSNLALVVPDYRVREFRTIDSIDSIEDLRIGFVDLSRGFMARLQRSLPNVELTEISNNRVFFEQNAEELDALLISAESGSAFTLMYPNYEVVVPEDLRVKLPLFYAIGDRGDELRELLEHWMTLRQKDGTAKEFYEHWILGKFNSKKQPRWCIARDVLGWL